MVARLVLNSTPQLRTPAVLEAALRTVCSEAYYAAYHAAVERSGFDASDHQSSHRPLWNRLSESRGTMGVANKGKALLTRRVRADYYLESTITQSEAQKAIEDADLLIAELATLPKV